MTHLPLTTKLAAIVGTLLTEFALFQASPSVEDWIVKNLAIIAAIAIAWGMLKRDVEHLKDGLKDKASNDRVDGIADKFDLIHTDVQAIRDLLENRHRS